MTDETQHQIIVDRGDLRKWRTELPNLYDDSDLDPYEFRLLAHYKRVGSCTEGLLTTAQKCKMSTGKVSEVRQSLADKGFVLLIEIKTRNGLGYRVEVVDKWAENFAYYTNLKAQKSKKAGSDPSPHEGSNGSTPHHMNGRGVDPSPHEGKPSPHEAKKELYEKEQEDSSSGAFAPGERARTQRQQVVAELEKQFSAITGLPLPRRSTDKEKRAASVRWWGPLWTLYTDLASCNLEAATRLMRDAVLKMKADRLTISSPQSISEVALSLFAERNVSTAFNPRRLGLVRT